MLDLMRRHAKSWIINVIIGAIVLVFVFWGAGSVRDRRPQHVAVINDEAIGITEYQETYRNLYEQARTRYQQMWSDELAEALNLKNQALENLINERLLYQAARAMKIEVSKEELRDSILNSPAFQLDGVFNAQKYRSILARIRYTPEIYEEIKRKELIIQKLSGRIMGFVKIMPAEVSENFHFTRDQVDVDFVLFKPESFIKQVKYSPEDLKSFYEKNKLGYQIPVKVKAAYLAVRPKELEDQVTIEPFEVEEYYEFNLDRYRQKEKVRARHILFKLEENAAEEEVAKVKVQAELVLKKAKAGDDFAELARKHSQGPTAKTGGDLGWFTQGQMVEPFSKTAFSMKKGEVSGLVRTQFGLHIIKVEDHQEAGVRTLEEVKDEILKKLTVRAAKELAADMAVEIYEKASLTQNFEAVIREYKLTPIITDFFSKAEPVKNLGFQRKFNDVAHSLKEGEIGPLVDLTDGHYLIKTIEKQKAYIPALDKIKATVENDLKNERAVELAQKEADRFLSEIKKGGNWDQLVKAFKLSPESTAPFTRLETIPKIGVNEALTAAAFTLAKPGQIEPKSYKSDKGFYIIRLKKFIPASEEEFEKEKAVITQRLQMTKSQSYFQQWLEALRAKAEIKIEEDMI
ncbi:MAG: SurA N-terminal domain-containing protein [Deltaproteobacteria bacterium]|nr:SurA N-terminal domain-containing protein [Deltaproteobacteria bacterium]MBW2051395.1 SurA N-terminal domain-containing protein [Deltaproteobacteria bacterium]MBW2140031.1 SurA N-terminal domain-containing protein [Deltaproteobacteria bacterium]MBW2321910.1 SurA N-terminal domain-containing protein [Deltaproteobacteria bacterium]